MSRRLRAAWRRSGKHLVVVSATPEPADIASIEHRQLAHVELTDRDDLARTGNTRPKHPGPRPRSIWMYAITPLPGPPSPSG